MEKNNPLKNVPMEFMGKVRKLADRLWAENNPLAVQLSVILEESEGEAAAIEKFVAGYERHYLEKMESMKEAHSAEAEELRGELAALRERNAAMHEIIKRNSGKITELGSALEKAEAEGREKYTREAVALLEQQVLDMKKEIVEFRRLKEIDGRRIMELESMVAAKGEEVARRYIGKTTLLEKERHELREQVAALEKAKSEDDARIKELRAALEARERECREKYTREEVSLLEQQILGLKNDISGLRQIKDSDEKRIAELKELLSAKTGDIEKKYIGRITMLENRNAELQALSAELEAAVAEGEKRSNEMKRVLAAKDREIMERYPAAEVKQLEETLAVMRKEAQELKSVKRDDEKRIAELEWAAGAKKEELERKYIGRMAALEARCEEASREQAALERQRDENAARSAELKKIVSEKDTENMELKARVADLELELNAKLTAVLAEKAKELAEIKGSFIVEQSRREQEAGRAGDDALSKLAERKKALEEEYLKKLEAVREKAASMEASYEARIRTLEGKEKALEADFAANKRELIKTFDRIRAELEQRELAIAEREQKLKRPGKEAGGEPERKI